MSTYRIFIRDSRVATAACLSDGSYLQTYPEREVFATQDLWVRKTLLANLDGRPRSYTLGLPDGSSITYLSGRYTLFQDGECVSAGYRMGSLYVQRYPYVAIGDRTDLVSERAPLFGVSTYLREDVKAPVVNAAPLPKERVSRWAKMSQQEREAWVARMRLGRLRARKGSDEFAALRALGEQSIAERSSRVIANPVWDLDTNEVTEPEGASYYTEDDIRQMHPSVAMVFHAFTQSYGPIRKSGEGCDCGNC